MNSSRIIELSHEKARTFFLKHSSYVNFDLPEYINFDELLRFVSIFMKDKKLANFCKAKEKPSNYENVNYLILSSKNGAYSWRPMQIIHPVLYVYLVRLITRKDNWLLLQKRFLEFEKSSVCCVSIPRESTDRNSDKSSQVNFWWERIEQESVKKTLDFNYIFLTDISDCYGSIYTHAFEWALDSEGKRKVKERLKKGKIAQSLGHWIDLAIRNMTYNQTNGIPQGSTLMDFLAEIILGYADEEITKRIHSNKINRKDFEILRYRDDYRIFVNDPNIGHLIMKLLSTVLYELGFKLNAVKTLENSDIVLSSIKPEKLERIFISPSNQSLQKESLRIYQLSKRYPDSGLLLKELSLFYDRLSKFKKSKKYENLEVLISIFTIISIYSPKTISWVSAIISVFLSKIKDKNSVINLITRIHMKFEKIPNTGLIDIWLQRISSPQGLRINYLDILTNVVMGDKENIVLWKSEWLSQKLIDIINASEVSSLKSRLREDKLSPTIGRQEVELFRLEYI